MVSLNPTDPIIEIEGNPTRPRVFFDRNTGVLRLKGRSILENAIRFYDPIVAWLDDYIKKPAPKTEFHLELEYFNTSTSKYILEIFEKLSEIYEKDMPVLVIWYYGDEDMQELGTDYQLMLNLPFEFRQLQLD